MTTSTKKKTTSRQRNKKGLRDLRLGLGVRLSLGVRLRLGVLLGASLCLGLGLGLGLGAQPAQADVLNYTVNITGTEGLNDPSALRFLLSGNGLNSGNQVTLSNFDFGTTGAGGAVTSGSPTLNDDLAFNRFNQNFTPGDSLSFSLAVNTDGTDVSNSGPSGTNDLFTLAILNGTSGPRLVTSAPDGFSFLTIAFDSQSNPSVMSFQSAATDAAGNVQPLLVATITPTAVPEPQTWAMLALGLGAILWTLRRRQQPLLQLQPQQLPMNMKSGRSTTLA